MVANDTGTKVRVPTSPVRPRPKMQVPQDVRLRYNARVLDPSTALQVAGQPPIESTVYVGDALLISPQASPQSLKLLETALEELDLKLISDPRQQSMRCHRVAKRMAKGIAAPRRVRLVPRTKKATAAPDAWKVIQTVRGLAGPDEGLPLVALDHLLTSATGPDIDGSPFVIGHGVDGLPFVIGHGVGSAQFAVPGWGGRQPVNWVGPGPARSDFGQRRRPVVAVLDTGVGKHPWLPAGIVRRSASVGGVKVADPERTGVTGNPLEGLLDPDAGHGTFIAGLIRQQCGDADILAIPIMGGDGIVAESNLLDALHMLVLRQEKALKDNDTSRIVDVVSLSLGYYHEQPADLAFDPQLLFPLQELGRLGVAVIAAAGNDSTNRPCFPAAFAPWRHGLVPTIDPGCLPIISVGARNPNKTTALFSNAGDWVKTHRPGASLVSSFPTTINGAQQASVSVTVSPDEVRATTDPDDFSAGFAVWSGTSFAGPVLAGEIAAHLCTLDLEDCDPDSMLARGWSAVNKTVPRLAP